MLATVAVLLAGSAFAQEPPAAPVPPPADPSLTTLRNPDRFICADGQLVLLEVDQAAGLMRGIRGGETFTLFQQVGRTPPRFVSGSDSVDLDGDTAHLRRGKQERQQCSRLPAQPSAGVVWGTLTKLDRMALPPGTRAKVLLVDGARMDAPAVELGSTEITTTGNQVPLHFVVRFDPARLAGPARPMLQARITDADGRLRYVTDTVNAIPTDAPPPSPVELKLVSTAGK